MAYVPTLAARYSERTFLMFDALPLAHFLQAKHTRVRHSRAFPILPILCLILFQFLILCTEQALP